MNYRFGRAVNAKEKPPAAVLALAVGLALACLGSAALAIQGEPIVKIPIGLEGDPGSIKVSAKTDKNGAFNFTKLPAGKYKLTIAGQPPQSITVGANRTITGTLTGNGDGTASLTIGDGKPVVLSGQIPSAAGVRVAAGDVNGDGVETRKAAPKKAAAAEPRDIFLKPPVTPRNGGDGKPGIADQAESGNFDREGNRAYLPPADINGNGKPATIVISGAQLQLTPGITITVNPVNDPPSKADTPVPSTVILLAFNNYDRDPGNADIAATTDEHGAFQFTGLPAGKYTLKLPDLLAKSVTIGDNGKAVGKVMRGADGVIRIWDDTDIVHSTAISQTINYTGLERTASSPKGGSISGMEMTDARTAPPPKNGTLPNIGVTGVDDKVADGNQPYKTAPGTGGGDGKLALPGLAGEPVPGVETTDVSRTRGTAPSPGGGDAKLPGILRVINNSETDTATVEAINGIGGTGGGRLTAGGAIDGVNVVSGNRDHIDQDAQTDIKKKAAVQAGGPGDARIRVSADVSTLRGTAPGTDGGDGKLPGTHRDRLINNSETAIYSAALPPKGGDDKLPGLAGEPIVITDQLGNSHVLVSRAATPSKGGDDKLPGLAGEAVAGLEVKLGKLGGGNAANATVSQSGSTLAVESIVSSKTDSQGNFYFDKLPAGNYEFTLPGLPSQALTVGADGIVGGKVMRGPDGSISIFDRWGNRTATSPKGGGSKTVEKPVGFGSGNTMGAGPGSMGLGGGMAPPGAGPAMGGAGSAMGGPGSAMRNR